VRIHVFGEFVVGLCNRLQNVGQFGADFGPFIFQFVVFFFVAEVIFFFVVVWILDSPDFLLYSSGPSACFYLTRWVGLDLVVIALA
jgi:hypothetical protein